MRGIYKKGNLLQAIEFIDKFQVASDILFDAYMKDKDNLKVLELMNFLNVAAFYVSFLERELANKEIDNQSTINKLYQTQKELEELWSVSPEEKLKNFENDSFS